MSVATLEMPRGLDFNRRSRVTIRGERLTVMRNCHNLVRSGHWSRDPGTVASESAPAIVMIFEVKTASRVTSQAGYAYQRHI